MDRSKLFAIRVASIYPLYVQKAEKKRRTKASRMAVACWSRSRATFTPAETFVQIASGYGQACGVLDDGDANQRVCAIDAQGTATRWDPNADSRSILHAYFRKPVYIAARCRRTSRSSAAQSMDGVCSLHAASCLASSSVSTKAKRRR